MHGVKSHKMLIKALIHLHLSYTVLSCVWISCFCTKASATVNTSNPVTQPAIASPQPDGTSPPSSPPASPPSSPFSNQTPVVAEPVEIPLDSPNVNSLQNDMLELKRRTDEHEQQLARLEVKYDDTNAILNRMSGDIGIVKSAMLSQSNNASSTANTAPPAATNNPPNTQTNTNNTVPPPVQNNTTPTNTTVNPANSTLQTKPAFDHADEQIPFMPRRRLDHDFKHLDMQTVHNLGLNPQYSYATNYHGRIFALIPEETLSDNISYSTSFPPNIQLPHNSGYNGNGNTFGPNNFQPNFNYPTINGSWQQQNPQTPPAPVNRFPNAPFGQPQSNFNPQNTFMPFPGNGYNPNTPNFNSNLPNATQNIPVLANGPLNNQPPPNTSPNPTPTPAPIATVSSLASSLIGSLIAPTNPTTTQPTNPAATQPTNLAATQPTNPDATQPAPLPTTTNTTPQTMTPPATATTPPVSTTQQAVVNAAGNAVQNLLTGLFSS